MDYLVFEVLALAVILGCLFREARRHEKNLQQLPLRIHVNGTRGKSSVTRLIAGGLRRGGRRVCAKTTGTDARFILPDGSEETIKRRGPANIRENIRLIRKAAALGADTIVFECMALQPELQKFCERRLLQSQIGVITNVRADHEDVMGRGLDNIAAALSNTVPEKGVLVTVPSAAQWLAPYVPAEKLVTVGSDQLGSEDLEGFPYPVVPENLALALKVCALAGVSKETALAGMRESLPDGGNLHLTHLTAGSKELTVIDALAANDPESTLWLWQQYVKPELGPAVVLLNCRRDRKLRTEQLCRALTQPPLREQVLAFVLAGDTGFAAARLRREGVAEKQIFNLKADASWQDLVAVLAQLPEEKLSGAAVPGAAVPGPEFSGTAFRKSALTLFAAGNIKGLSENLRTGLSGG